MQTFNSNDIIRIEKLLVDISFLITNKVSESFPNILKQRTTDCGDYHDVIKDLIKYAVDKSDILTEHNFNISTEHKKETFSILNSYFKNYTDNCNIKAIIIFGDDDEINMLKSYFSLYKKYNNIKIEYYVNDKHYILMYDNPPIAIKLNNILETNYGNKKMFNVYFESEKIIHNTIKFNFNNDIKKFVRKLKIDKINKNV